MIKMEEENFTASGAWIDLMTEFAGIVYGVKALIAKDCGERFAVDWIERAVEIGISDDFFDVDETAKAQKGKEKKQ